MNKLFDFWRDFVARIDYMDHLIDDDDETTASVECWKWEEIKHAKR